MSATAIFTNQAERLFSSMLFSNAWEDRPANLEVMLITNPVSDLSAETTYGNLVEVPAVGYGYNRKDVQDANWAISSGVATYTPVVFVPTADVPGVTGIALVTKSASPKVVFIITDSAAPTTILAGSPYVVAMSVATTSTTRGNVDFLLSLLLKRDVAARGTGLSMVLITNEANVSGKTLADLAQPSSVGGYLAHDLVDGNWIQTDVAGDAVNTYPPLIFTPTGEVFSSSIAGYAIVTKVAPYNVVSVELDPTRPVDIDLNTPYLITPSIKVI